MRSDSGDDGHGHGDDRGLDFTSKLSRSRHDRVPIALQSGHDRTTIVVLAYPLSVV